MPEAAQRELTFAQAVREALAEEMRRDSRVCIFGEDVAEAGTPFKVLSGLVEEFGAERVLDTPISEAGFTGMGVGAAMTGLRPVVDIMFGDFLTLTMDQMVNQAAKVHYMSGGTWKVPMVLRTTLGATRRSAAQHSQSLHAWLSHVPGLKVVMPSTPYDAKGLLKTAIRDDNPVAFFEDKMMYKQKGPVPEEEYTIPLGVADVKRKGEDITLVATSSMVQVALAAAKLLEEIGVSAEVIDPRTTWPLDEKTLVESAKKTSRAIILDEGYGRYGVTGEIASVISEGAFFNLEAPVKRMGAMHVPIPFSPPLEDATVPTEQTVFDAARTLCGKAREFSNGRRSVGLKTFGAMAVDWENRIDFDRLRRERLARAKELLAKSQMGALLCFDMNNVRYITATHIGTWAQDKISRFCLLPQTTSRSCGTSAPRRGTTSRTARGLANALVPAFLCCVAPCLRKWVAQNIWQRKIKVENGAARAVR